MKRIIATAALLAWAFLSRAQKEITFNDTAYLQPVEVQAIRAAENAPFAKNNLDKKQIDKGNLGQDLPFLLNQLPSVVVNSDAGNGVGYTGIRIRGTDATRINITLNGIPYNDAESQGTFFVDLPDILSSASSIQVQRGVGTSTNGAGAFGASINLATNEINKDAYFTMHNSFGSFNTSRNNIQFGTGIQAGHLIFDGRLSLLHSDGYIERAKSDLRSAYGSMAWVDENNSVRLNIFSGKEKTYQAWYGVPENLLDSARTYNPAGTEKPGAPYDNETDNYLQTHYQLFFNHRFNNNWKGNLAVFFTKGRGYYEEYRAAQLLADYGLPNYNNGGSIVSSTDLVRRLWLENNFYGSVASLQYTKKATRLIFGGGWNGYDGNHYGEVIRAIVQAAVPAHYHWYDVNAHKKDLSFYGKWTEQLSGCWQSFLDVQYRNIPYFINGFAANPGLLIRKNYSFFNPKMGVTFNHRSWKLFTSFAIAGKEPNRDDFEAGITQQPKPETLYDLETGSAWENNSLSLGIVLYYMRYHDQLVLTGRINDVGAYTRTNIPNSYRSGIEITGKYIFSKWMNLEGNLALSRNRISSFTEYLDDYDNGGQQTKYYPSTDISFSPGVVAGASINLLPTRNSTINLTSKYVGRQYLDNTSQRSRSLHPYFLEDVQVNYQPTVRFCKTLRIVLQLINIFGKKYESNGYSYSFISGGSLTTQNNYFPMAGRNWMMGVNVGF